MLRLAASLTDRKSQCREVEISATYVEEGLGVQSDFEGYKQCSFH